MNRPNKQRHKHHSQPPRHHHPLPLETKPELWSPIAGETLQGQIISFESKYSKLLKKIQLMMVVENAKGELKIFWVTDFINQELLKQGGVVGANIRITFSGKRISKSSGREYNLYEIHCRTLH